jgi:hypothetical protein
LLAAGKQVVLLTGDAPSVARRVADLGIADVRAGVTPQGKHACVSALQAAGAVVAMVGDGVNDAPVLAQAQVSVAMGGGAQLARTQADFVLLSENLDHLRRGLLRGRRPCRVIRQNLWWSFAYNFVALPLAIAGYVTPWLAGIGMSASSLLVVLNSLRIQRLDTGLMESGLPAHSGFGGPGVRHRHCLLVVGAQRAVRRSRRARDFKVLMDDDAEAARQIAESKPEKIEKFDLRQPHGVVLCTICLCEASVFAKILCWGWGALRRTLFLSTFVHNRLFVEGSYTFGLI